MSCWVVPTVAADYWGVTLDVVWRRLRDGLVPHKTEQGFVFIDVDPWTTDVDGSTFHEPPATFVLAGKEISLEESILKDAFAPDETERANWNDATSSAEGIKLLEDELFVSDPWDITPGQGTLADDEPEPVFAFMADDEGELEDSNRDPGAGEELPDLDEEETATFGRLSWQEVRSQVSRTRCPPSSRA